MVDDQLSPSDRAAFEPANVVDCVVLVLASTCCRIGQSPARLRMTLDHYVPRFLTRRWEIRSGELLYFDFPTERFDEGFSRTFFAIEGLNSPEVEAMLDREIETPVSQFLSRTVDRGLPPDINRVRKHTLRALALLFMLNPQRIAEARGQTPDDKFSLQEIATSKRDFLDVLAQYFVDNYKWGMVPATPSLEFFFPENGAFAVPTVGTVTLGMPLTPGWAFVALQSDTFPNRHLQHMRDTALIVGLSVGIADVVQRVVLPPSWHDFDDRADQRECLKSIRLEARGQFNAIQQAAYESGWRAWKAG